MLFCILPKSFNKMLTCDLYSHILERIIVICYRKNGKKLEKKECGYHVSHCNLKLAHSISFPGESP